MNYLIALSIMDKEGRYLGRLFEIVAMYRDSSHEQAMFALAAFFVIPAYGQVSGSGGRDDSDSGVSSQESALRAELEQLEARRRRVRATMDRVMQAEAGLRAT